MRVVCAGLLMLVANVLCAQDKPVPKFTLLDWNVEAGGSDVGTILDQLKQLEPFDVMGLSEVPAAAADKFTSRWPGESVLLGTAGGNSRLLLAWNPQVFEKVSAQELKKVGDQEFSPGIQAAPLVAQLRHKSSGQEIVFVMLHLARGSAELRKKQSLLLVDWAKQQTLPVIAVGGFNFDYDFVKHKGNESFEAFTAADVFQWIKPKAWVDTNWSDRNRDGKDDYPDSMLDYAFVSGAAKNWSISCEVIVRPGDFPDTDSTSDHRPLVCRTGT
jgi:hypothetical protein